MNKRTVVLSFAAGLAGGLLSQYAVPALVHAQSQPKEVRAESFLLVNRQGVVLGTLAEDAGRPAIKLFDREGREIWSAGGKIGLQRGPVGK